MADVNEPGEGKDQAPEDTPPTGSPLLSAFVQSSVAVELGRQASSPEARPGGGSIGFDFVGAVRRVLDTPPAVIIVTCSGRLAHLKQTLPAMAEAFPVFVVDYACPDRTAEWCEAQPPQRVVPIRVERQPEGPPFWKTYALNSGAHAAFQWFPEVERLVFLDADTVVHDPAQLRELVSAMPPNWFMMAARRGGVDLPGLTGILAVGSDFFVSAEGYDHRFKGWGSEDEDMRLVLAAEGAEPRWFPDGLFSAVKHDDAQRVARRVAEGFTLHRSWKVSRMELFSKWTLRLGVTIRTVKDLPDELRGLLFRPPGFGGEAF